MLATYSINENLYDILLLAIDSLVNLPFHRAEKTNLVEDQPMVSSTDRHGHQHHPAGEQNVN